MRNDYSAKIEREMERIRQKTERKQALANRKMRENQRKIAKRIERTETPKLTDEQRGFMVEMEFYRTRYPAIFQNIERVVEADILAMANDEYAEGEDYTELSGFSLSKAISSVKKAVTSAVKPVAKFVVNPIASIKDQVSLGSKAASSGTAKKIVKAASQLNPAVIVNKALVPKKIQAQGKKFEQKHRKEIKIAGAVAATAVGAYALAPGMVGGLASQGAMAGKAMAIGLAKKLGIDETVKGVTTEALYEKAKGKISEKITDEMADYVKRIGKEKFEEIVSRYAGADGTVPTDPDDPKLVAMQAELMAAADNISPAVARASIVANNQAETPLKKALPYIAPAAALTALFLA